MTNLKNNLLQFAVVREDPETEIAVINSHLTSIKKILLIGSGGCTALSIRNQFPHLKQTLIEPNSAQIDLIRLKEKLLEIGDKKGLIELSQKGNFESLFRQLREFIYEFIISEKALKNAILKNNQDEIMGVISHKYWPVGFDLFFSDSILNTMFGPDATQHAPKSSYPIYFRKVFEYGLTRGDCSTNYFIHHLLFSSYYPSTLPGYITANVPDLYANFELKNCLIHELDSFNEYDFMSFSNIFDWADIKYIEQLALKIKNESKKGSIIMFRQLNNPRDFKKIFAPEYKFNEALELKLLEKDRSLFYSKLCIGVKL